MEKALGLDVVQEIRLLARRMFDLAEAVDGRRAPSAARLCRLVGQILRRVRRDPIRGTQPRTLAAAFRLVSDAVDRLDELARQAPEVRVPASALAAEATELATQLFDRIEARSIGLG
ncbi:MAG: hypothetical protein D6776_00180 [Planctomycetota bacterium]|nr:MAG: hypothetical protein D6776_00180 [Planctomycetota bacterium]